MIPILQRWVDKYIPWCSVVWTSVPFGEFEHFIQESLVQSFGRYKAGRFTLEFEEEFLWEKRWNIIKVCTLFKLHMYNLSRVYDPSLSFSLSPFLERESKRESYIVVNVNRRTIKQFKSKWPLALVAVSKWPDFTGSNPMLEYTWRVVLKIVFFFSAPHS